MSGKTETLRSPSGGDMAFAVDATGPAPPRDDAVVLPPGTSVGRYTIGKLLGEGGMGQVYAAADPELDRTVAIKVVRAGRAGVSEAARLRFLREAQAMARLVHPNVVSVYDVGAYDERVFVAMELVDGETLGAWLARAPRGWREVRDVFLAAGRGLLATHEAGIVHRDFKPDNVLVCAGRVVLADFGLARAEAAGVDEARAATSGSMLALGLTGAGGVIGTPGYVAPELLAGGAATPRADQYSFCVALGEALVRPPRFLAAVVERGRRPRPEARYPSLAPLLADMARDPGRTARRVALAVGAVAAVAAGGYMLAASRRGPSVEEACARAAGDSVAAVWNDARRGSIERAFTAAPVPFAAAALQNVVPALAGYAGALVTAQDEACRATEVRHAQSEALLDLRVACLARRRQSLDALAAALGGPLAAGDVERAPGAAAQLPRIADCADTAQLQAVVPLPAGAAERARVEQALRGVDEVATAYGLGRYAAAKAALARLEPLGYAPLESDVAFWRAWFQYKDSEPARDQALASLRQAVAARDARREQRGWLLLYQLLADDGTRLAEAEEVRLADELALERAGRPVDESALHDVVVARMYANAGNHDAAEKQLRDLLARLPAGDVWNRGTALDLLARVLMRNNHTPEALQVAGEALALWEKALGPDHPRLVEALLIQGKLDLRLERFAEAETALERARRVQEAAYGAGHARLQDVYGQLGTLAAARHDAEAMRRWSERSLATLGPEADAEPNAYVGALDRVGYNLVTAGLAADGLAVLERAAARAARGGVTRRHVALNTYYQGIALLSLGRHAEALARCTDAEKALGELQPQLVASAGMCVGEALLGLGRSREAAATLERTLVAFDKDPSPGQAADLRFLLARALWDSGRDRRRALALADEASAGSTQGPAIEAWRRGKTAR